MSDPKPGLKLPLRAVPGRFESRQWSVVGADGRSIWLTKHHAEVIVAALEADAENQARAESGEKQCTCMTNQLGPDYCARCQA